MAEEKPKEGWGLKAPGERVYHYYDENGRSLCGRRGFYHDEKEPDDGGPKQKDDCAECFRKLIKRRKG